MKRMSFIMLVVMFSLLTVGYTDALCVSAQKANLRTGPGTNYDVAWEVYKYMPFSKVGLSLSGYWYAVKDVDGDVNWIHRGLLNDKYKCAVVKTDEVNLRGGPGTNYSKVGVAKKYFSFRVIGKKGVWIKIKDEWNSTGWIHRNFLWIK